MGNASPAALAYTPLRSYRYERKFLVDELLPGQVQSLVRLHPRLFYAPYPPRWVNNLYFDTPDLENYYDNVSGASQRRKIRVRWYGPPFGEVRQPLLEYKVKQGTVGAKHTYPMASFNFQAGFGDRDFQETATSSRLPENVAADLRGLHMVLFNRYYRQYYATRDGAFRLTIDTDMCFYRANGAPGNLFIHHQKNYQELVVELKYETDQESQADQIASFFPFRVTRNSKYVQGVERVYF